MYAIFRRVEDDELMEVAVTESREQAEKFLKRLQEVLPSNQYELREVEPKAPGPRAHRYIHR